MRRTLVAFFFALVLVNTGAFGARWTERYFGVGSADQQSEACAGARSHAEGNSSHACSYRQGTRGDVSYTECKCAPLAEGGHVCNVNLKVSCDGPDAKAELRGDGPSRTGGEPKGRADRLVRRSGRGPRALSGRSGLEDRWRQP